MQAFYGILFGLALLWISVGFSSQGDIILRRCWSSSSGADNIKYWRNFSNCDTTWYKYSSDIWWCMWATWFGFCRAPRGTFWYCRRPSGLCGRRTQFLPNGDVYSSGGWSENVWGFKIYSRVQKQATKIKYVSVQGTIYKYVKISINLLICFLLKPFLVALCGGHVNCRWGEVLGGNRIQVLVDARRTNTIIQIIRSQTWRIPLPFNTFFTSLL